MATYNLQCDPILPILNHQPFFSGWWINLGCGLTSDLLPHPPLYHISWSPDHPPGLLTGLLPHLNHLSPPSPPCSESPPVTLPTNNLHRSSHHLQSPAPLHDGQLSLHWQSACGRQPQCHTDHQAHHAGQGEIPHKFLVLFKQWNMQNLLPPKIL